MSSVTIQIDIDAKWDPTLAHHLTVPPHKWQGSPRGGAHLEYTINDVPDWVAEAQDGEKPYARYRREEFALLVRDLIAGATPGYDRHAPIRLRTTGDKWKTLSNSEYTLPTLIASVDGRALGRNVSVSPEVTAALEGYGYERGGRYTRDMCWRHDHVSGGGGKGTCVCVMPDGAGVFCYGDHSDSVRPDGYAYISSTALLAHLSGQPVSSEDEPLKAVRTWAAVTPMQKDAEAALRAILPAGEPVVPLVAALRLGALLKDPTPRPTALAQPNTAEIVWDADQRLAAQMLPGCMALDNSIDIGTRTSDCAYQYPALLAYDLKSGEWGPHKNAVQGLLKGDAARVATSGIRVIRMSPVPSAFEDEWFLLRGVPARRVLPPGARPTDPVGHLRRLLDSLPMPEGMGEDDQEALRLCWLVPALTESCPGALPLVMFTGGSGAGKGVTVSAIGRAWHHHLNGSMAVDDAKEIDNKLVAGRAGGIWTLDELSESGGAALPKRVMNHLKAVMTHAYHDARIFHAQKIAPLRMAHAWYSTGRTMSGLDSRHQTDWRRRSIIVQFPAHECAASYTHKLERVVEAFEPVETAYAITDLLRDSTTEERTEWSRAWPAAMPGWQWLVGIVRKHLNRGPVHAAFKDRLPMDRSAVDSFIDWWQTTEADTFRTGGPHSFRAILSWLASIGQRFDGAAALATQLIEQTQNTKKFNVPKVQDLPAGTVTIYDTGQYRWKYSPDKGDEKE